MQKIKRADTVLVTKGKDRGKQGEVRRVITAGTGTDKFGRPDPARIVVTGVNMVKRHMKPRGQNKPGGIIEREGSIHLSNVMLVDPNSDKPTRVGMKALSDGKKVRVARRSGEMLDKT